MKPENALKIGNEIKVHASGLDAPSRNAINQLVDQLIQGIVLGQGLSPSQRQTSEKKDDDILKTILDLQQSIVEVKESNIKLNEKVIKLRSEINDIRKKYKYDKEEKLIKRTMLK